ncbi:uncharacterized protein LOC141686548 [Apium graveolens]|uniref:uncharacterized protein LOC141686548 n=1 Tax=Apium graveolens TaxID=4045 RepID=UPI003D792E3D
MNLLTAWRKAQVNGRGTRLTSNVQAQWEKPPDGWVHINVDAALFEDTRSIGLGSVARDAAGQFIKARSSRWEGLMIPREAEAMGLKEALSWAQASNFRRCIFEIDSQILAVACKGRCDRSYFDTLVLECITLFQHFDDVLVVFVRRSANLAAHLLAKAASSLSGSREWH